MQTNSVLNPANQTTRDRILALFKDPFFHRYADHYPRAVECGMRASGVDFRNVNPQVTDESLLQFCRGFYCYMPSLIIGTTEYSSTYGELCTIVKEHSNA